MVKATHDIFSLKNCNKIGRGSELTVTSQTIGGREKNNLTHNTVHCYAQTIVGREHSRPTSI